MNKLMKGAMFTDIHFGRKSNSQQHNQDCLDFIDWFCDYVKNDTGIDHCLFLGDWYQNRTAINVETLQLSYIGAKKLNSLGIPIYFIIGNHDLYHKSSRNIFSTFNFNALNNFILIDKPQIRSEIGSGCMLSPFLFRDEYYDSKLMQNFKKAKIWFGHFEFKGFIISGSSDFKMPSGPEPKDFPKQEFMFSGHFHKRQISNNVIYIGNTFPFDFSDVDDFERGLCVFDHKTQKYYFENWKDCPKFTKIKLSKLLLGIKNKNISFSSNTSIRCLIDVDLTFEYNLKLKNIITTKFKLRNLEFEEDPNIKETLSETETNIDWIEEKNISITDLVIKMLKNINSDHIDNSELVDIYSEIRRR